MRPSTCAVSVLLGLLAAADTAVAGPLPQASVLLAPASYIGVGVIDVTEDTAKAVGLVEPHGVEICSVADGSPAQRFGLRVGDIVLTYRDERIQGHEHFARLVQETPVGRAVELGIARDRSRQSVIVETGERPGIGAVSQRMGEFAQDIEAIRDMARSAVSNLQHRQLSAEWPFDFDFPAVHITARNSGLGVGLEGLEGQLAEFFGVESGVLVRHVQKGSQAAKAGLRAGDVIVTVDGEAVARPGDIRRLTARAGDPAPPVRIGIVRQRQRSTLMLGGREPNVNPE